MIRMVCATATSARLAPLLAAKRRYCVARYVCLACVAAQAASTRVARSQGLPGPMWLLRRLPALSSLLGHTRAQQVRPGRKAADVRADLGQDGLRYPRPDARNRV